MVCAVSLKLGFRALTLTLTLTLTLIGFRALTLTLPLTLSFSLGCREMFVGLVLLLSGSRFTRFRARAQARADVRECG